uniref:Uncharacterized protein n=1 Tax=Rousettus aegyptiacus TaxID=9407 RepID=A0A7J8BDT0_ROUAE|nr:hypothetical protein HJG63_009699 [Rousettus aegyptiacus]
MTALREGAICSGSSSCQVAEPGLKLGLQDFRPHTLSHHTRDLQEWSALLKAKTAREQMQMCLHFHRCVFASTRCWELVLANPFPGSGQSLSQQTLIKYLRGWKCKSSSIVLSCPGESQSGSESMEQ